MSKLLGALPLVYGDKCLSGLLFIIMVQQTVMEFASMESVLLRVGKHRGERIMANVSKLILTAAITAASITTPALAAHSGKPIHHVGYVTRSSQGHGVYNFAPVAPRSTGVLPPEQQCGGSCDPYGHAITGGN